MTTTTTRTTGPGTAEGMDLVLRHLALGRLFDLARRRADSPAP
jgi:hypothetical protein